MEESCKWTVEYVTLPLRGDPEGFWQANDYVLVICQEGVFAVKLSRWAMTKAILGYGLIVSNVQEQFSGKSFDDDGTQPLVRYRWPDVQKIVLRKIVLSQSMIGFDSDNKVHSYRYIQDVDWLPVCDAITQLAPTLVVKERHWCW